MDLHGINVKSTLQVIQENRPDTHITIIILLPSSKPIACFSKARVLDEGSL